MNEKNKIDNLFRNALFDYNEELPSNNTEEKVFWLLNYYRKQYIMPAKKTTTKKTPARIKAKPKPKQKKKIVQKSAPKKSVKKDVSKKAQAK